jgi:hypothetical protein
MNIGAMLLLTALIFAEKALPFSRPVRIAAAGALATWGTLILFDPRFLPVMMGMEYSRRGPTPIPDLQER